MYRKALLVVASIFFAIGILTTSVLRTSAQTQSDSYQVQPVTSPTPVQESQKVDYFLAYPGMLPDQFIYPVKMLRDKVWLFLTTDPLKRAEMNLLYADKRIFAAKLLTDKGKNDLAVTTATKAEKYLEESVAQAKIAGENGKDVKPLLNKLSLATRKHGEVLTQIKETIDESNKGEIEQILAYPQRLKIQISQLQAQ